MKRKYTKEDVAKHIVKQSKAVLKDKLVRARVKKKKRKTITTFKDIMEGKLSGY